MEEIKARGWSRDLALKAGLVTEREGGRVGDTFRGRIMFPIRNQAGDTVAFGGRVLDPEAQPKYLNSPETILFSKRRTLYGIHEALPTIRKTGRLLLLEGYMDVIGAHQHGIDWAVAPLGTALTNEHAGLIGRYAKDTIVMFDDDRAGINASVRAAEIFMEAGMYVRLANVGNGQDPDEFLNDHGREEFERIMGEAADPLDFRMNLFFKGRKTPPGTQEKAQAIAVLLETVARQPDEILKSEWVKSLAARFGVEEASVLKELRKVSVQAPREVKRDVVLAVKAMLPIERGFIQLMLRDPGLDVAALKPEDFSNPLARDFFAALQGMAPEARAKASTELTSRFPEQAPLIMELAVADFGDEASPQNVTRAIRIMKRNSLERRRKELKAAGQMTQEQLEEYNRIMTELKSSANEI
jgi:DNA primase